MKNILKLAALVTAAFISGLCAALPFSPALPPLSSADRAAIVDELKANSRTQVLYAEYYAYHAVDRAYYLGIAQGLEISAGKLETWHAAPPHPATLRP